MQGWERAINTYHSQTPAVSNCFVNFKMLAIESTKHLFNLSIDRIVSQKKILIQLFLRYRNE